MAHATNKAERMAQSQQRNAKKSRIKTFAEFKAERERKAPTYHDGHKPKAVYLGDEHETR